MTTAAAHATRTERTNRRMKRLRLEQLSEFEVDLPARVGYPDAGIRRVRLRAIQAVAEIDAERAERGDGREADARAPEEPRRVEVARTVPEVARVVERVHVQVLVHPHAQLGRRREEGAAEGRAAGVVAVGPRHVPRIG